jgi:hypothetical protein
VTKSSTGRRGERRKRTRVDARLYGRHARLKRGTELTHLTGSTMQVGEFQQVAALPKSLHRGVVRLSI